MDRVVKVSRSFLNRIRGFLNIFAGECRGCMRRVSTGCVGCDSLVASELMREIDNIKDSKEERYFVENPSEEIKSRIVRALEQAGKPVPSVCIRLSGVDKQRKRVILRKMFAAGIINMVEDPVNDGKYIYSLNNNTQTKGTR